MASELRHTIGSAAPHGSLCRSPGGNPLDQLEPQPDIARLFLDESPPRARLRRPVAHAQSRGSFINSSHGKPYSAGLSSKLAQLPIFAGPPPPISASTIMTNAASSKRTNTTHGGGIRGLSGALINRTREASVSQALDSAWRGLRRRQRGLEQETQQLLDLQAAALVAGSSGGLGTGFLSNSDGRSDEGSITPVDTFSTASVGSRMPKSLYISPRSTPEGIVIPVRQPVKPRRRGLQAARNGIRESLEALADLKREEDAHANAALSDRKAALARLDSLGTKKIRISEALEALEHDLEEPLGQELRNLGSEYDSVDDEIRQLEGKLAEMRNRRRWLAGRIEDVKSKRAAGLSGYRGALKDVDVEVSTLLHRPLIQPLDQEILGRGENSDEEVRTSGGLEFMRLIPQRRTVEMAKAWWGAEIEILERQKASIGEEQRALEHGSIVWQEVVSLVTHFESRLRETMKDETGSSAMSLVSNRKKSSPREDLIQRQLPLMGEVVTALAQHMQVAESKHWKLLICAIGAEWEAFREAHDVLKSFVDGAIDGVTSEALPVVAKPEEDAPANHGEPGRDDIQIESDNEVPADLLVSRLNDTEREHAEKELDQVSVRRRRVSENDVPPEFLAEHHPGEDL